MFKGDEVEAIQRLLDLSTDSGISARATGTEGPDPGEQRGAFRGALGGQNGKGPWTTVDSSVPARREVANAQTFDSTALLQPGQGLATMITPPAGVAELADATDSKSVGS